MLKQTLLSAIFLLASVGPAFAAPLLSVTKNSGFVAPEYSYHVECSIGSRTTLMRTRLGENGRTLTRSFSTRYTRGLNNAFRVANLIASVADGRLVTTPGPTDMPTSSYYAFLETRRVTLLIDESIRRIRNSAPGVNSLIQLADLNCPVPRR
ncbi:MAG: hypothetical protein ACXVB9_17810 [Bdellovibrionota bacterium]